MKTLIQKELRENLKLALPTMALLVFRLAHMYENEETQPLLSGAVLSFVVLVSALFGLALGWFQIRNERPRDLWNFLVHRPVSRDRIFLAKAAAGLTLHGMAVGVPLLALVIACAIPGRFASPFEWAMVWPLAGSFVMGMLWYFAGMLTAIRPARWYASRGLVLVATLFMGIVALDVPSQLPGFSQQHLVLAFGGLALAVAVWGAFRGDGSDGSQPAWGKPALSAVLAFGVVGAGLLLQIPLETLLLHGQLLDSKYHEITSDGAICVVTLRPGKPAEISDLAGVPLSDPQTGLKLGLAKFDGLTAASTTLSADFGDQSQVRNAFQRSSRFYCLWQTANRINWYWRHDGTVEGYDTVTRRLAGTIQPRNPTGESERFLRPQVDLEADADADAAPQNPSLTPILATSKSVFAVNLQDRSARAFFTTTDDDPVGAAGSVSGKGVIVVTRHSVRMMTLDGESVWKLPSDSTNSAPRWVKVSKLKAPDQYAVWIGPYNPANRRNSVENRRYSKVFLVSAGQGATKLADLRPINLKAGASVRLSWRLASLSLPPLPGLYYLLGWRATPWDQIEISFGTAVLCALAGGGLGRRYGFTFRAQLGWAAFHLAAGLPGFVAFLSVQDWPARERCANCHKMRVVDHALCRYCQAEFAPAEKNGTEIFEPLVAR